METRSKKIENRKVKVKEEKGLRTTPPQVKRKRKEPVKSVKKKKKFKEDEARKKIELKCTNVDDLVRKLKAFSGALHNNKSLETHLMQDQSKWNFDGIVLKQSTRVTARPDCEAARTSSSTYGSLYPGRVLVRPHCATTRSRNPILDALCDHRPAAGLYMCLRTYRAPTRYPGASSWWDELL
ncbi:hypothetical protein PIB30_088052 [Stylosanthes scabra]|uniref:Uncharacterized protein n=1 Tax=Stylosanthes scabra TaxID=79078 RepID=A0ABU6WS05_9FABA|nr:hypothetical protein [Stylosanthes scabra]